MWRLSTLIQACDSGGKSDIILSVVVGVRNGEPHIRGCLERIYSQNLPQSEFEVLVLDGRSEDGTRAEVEQFVAEHRIENLRVLDNPRRTLAAAFNEAAKYARGKYVAKVDAQSRISKGYFKTLLRVLEENQKVGLVGGRFAPTGQTKKAMAFAQVLTDPYLVGPAKYRYTREMTELDTVYLGIYRRKAMAQVGEFDESLLKSEDTDFNFRLRQAGWKVVLVPSVHAEYYVRETFRASWIQFFGYGLWRTAFVLKHGLPLGVRQVVPIAWILMNLISIVGAMLSGELWWLTPSLGYMLLAFGRASLRVRPPGLGLVYGALLYPVIHAAYAMGVAVGLFRDRGLVLRALRATRVDRSL